MAGFKSALGLAKATWSGFSEDEATWKAAALSYYTVFALAPLLVILLQIASVVWNPAEIRQALTGQFQELMGADVARQVQTMMLSVEQKAESGGGIRWVLSIAGLVFGATGAFVSLQTALNRAWEVEPDPKAGGIKTFISKRLFSLGMVLAIAFLVLVSLALTAVLSAVGAALFGSLGQTVGRVLNFTLTFAVISVLFAAMFKVLPDAEVEWRDVWVGAIGTAALFTVGKFLIGLYIGKSDPGSAFGAAGSLAVLLVWIYYAAVIVLLGAEFTQAWIRSRGREIVPEKGAIRVVQRKHRVREDGEVERVGKKHADVGEPSSTDAVRVEMADTRDRLSETLAALDARLAEATQETKRRLNPTTFVREHPWPVLAAAVAAGITLSAVHGDDSVSGDGVPAHVGDDAEVPATHGAPEQRDASEARGLLARTKTRVAEAARSQVGQLERELRSAADELARPGM